jgi:hypothetical protein
MRSDVTDLLVAIPVPVFVKKYKGAFITDRKSLECSSSTLPGLYKGNSDK